MDDDLVFSENERPRYLLPEGCKDLNDVIRMQERDADIEKRRAAISSALEKYASMAKEDPTSFLEQLSGAQEKQLGAASKGLPLSITIPDPVTVGDLAAMLNMKPFRLISALIRFHVFASAQSEISFEIAAKVCANLRVAVKKVDES